MASAQATAERFARAKASIQAAMEKLSEQSGVALPPPAYNKLDSREAMAAYELDRIAVFMTQLAGMETHGEGEQAPTGAIGDGYVDTEANKPADEQAPPSEDDQAIVVDDDVPPDETQSEDQHEHTKKRRKKH